ncbi:MAG: PepSY domain-containing protein, partial [Gammaproteobacteria bacterium]
MIRTLHRRLGLALALFWLIQVISGVVIVFRWELDDATLAAPSVSLNPRALGARIEAIVRANGKVSSMWASGRAADRFDIYYADPSGAERVMRVDGVGGILRDISSDAVIARGGIFNALTKIHESLLAGETGSWIVGISGAVLLVNLMLGLKLAWPRTGTWRGSLYGRPGGPPEARRHGWHRMLGLWIRIPASLVVATGVLLVFEDGLEAALGARIPTPVASSRPRGESARPPGPGRALSLALLQYPGATISALSMPEDAHAWFRIRLRRPDEVSRIWGTTTLFVSAQDGQVIDKPQGRGSVARRFLDTLYPFHTGQLGGLPGRL